MTLLPAAIDAGVGMPALRICRALCGHQRGHHPVVFVATRELEEKLGMDRRMLHRYLHQLEAAGLLRITLGGGRQAQPRGHEGRANTYMLGSRLTGAVEVVIKGDSGVTVASPERVTRESPYRLASEISNGDRQVTPPLRGTSYPSGGSGGRTAALTGGPSPDEPSPLTIAPHRFRELLHRFSMNKESP